MGIFSGSKNTSSPRTPKVGCPRCGNVHEINADCRCPGCGLKYKLPKEYDVYIENARAKAMQPAGNPERTDNNVQISAEEHSKRELKRANMNRRRKKSGTIIKLSVFAVLFSALFLTLMLTVFKDKDALVFKTGEYENQPVFYHTTDGKLHCVFPNKKSCEIGKGELMSYIASADGKSVYITYSGEFVDGKTSNYVLKISGFGKKVEKISENKDYGQIIVSGGNNMYLYILTPTDELGSLFSLTLSVDGKTPSEIAKDVCEIAVSTSGRYALISLMESGTSKMMVYSAAKNELTNPGIKNAHPLSVDNKGEYMIYARKNTADSTDIIVEKSTTERVEIPVFKESQLKSLIFSEDRRTFAAEYTDKTIFYTCSDKDYSISNTYEGSLFGYDFNDNVNYNYLSFKEIPKISNTFGKNLLPYYYFDKEHGFVYVVTNGGTRESVFDTHVIEDLRVSEGERCAFTADGVLYTGKLNKKNNDITKLTVLGDKSLVDISADGKYVYYTDADGNLFKAEYGKEITEPNKVAVDPSLIKTVPKSDDFILVSDGTASIIDKKGKSHKLCDGVDTASCVVASDDLSCFFYVTSSTDKDSGEVRKSLYLYSNGKSKLISEKLTDVCTVRDSARIDITKSYYVDVTPPVVQEEANNSNADTPLAAPEVQNNNGADTEIPVPVDVPIPVVVPAA